MPEQIRQPVNRRVVVVAGGGGGQLDVTLTGGFERFHNGRMRPPRAGTVGTVGTVGVLGVLVFEGTTVIRGH